MKGERQRTGEPNNSDTIDKQLPAQHARHVRNEFYRFTDIKVKSKQTRL